jgi:hypothetical protein
MARFSQGERLCFHLLRVAGLIAAGVCAHHIAGWAGSIMVIGLVLWVAEEQ